MRHVARHSHLTEYPQELTREKESVRLLAERIESLKGLYETELGDTDTHDLATLVITDFEKNAWFLRASLEG